MSLKSDQLEILLGVYRLGVLEFVILFEGRGFEVSDKVR